MEISAVTKQIVTIIDSVLHEKLENKYESATELFFYHILDRVSCNCKGIQLITSSAENIRDAEHSLGLTCRNQITDILILAYILLESKTDLEINEKVLLLYKDDYDFLMSMSNIIQNTNEIREEIKKKKNEFETAFGSFVKAPKSNEDKFPSITRIIKMLQKHGIPSNKNDIFHHSVLETIQFWIIFSKYEHIGYNSYVYTRGKNFEYVVFYVKSVLKASCILTANLLARFGVEQDALKPLISSYFELKKDIDIINERISL